MRDSESFSDNNTKKSSKITAIAIEASRTAKPANELTTTEQNGPKMIDTNKTTPELKASQSQSQPLAPKTSQRLSQEDIKAAARAYALSGSTRSSSSKTKSSKTNKKHPSDIAGD